MLNRYRNEFICDLAQTYNIYDFKSLPARQVAIFLYGLEDGSRVKQKLNGIKGSFNEIMIAMIFDRLQWLCWVQTKDGQQGRNRPQSVAEKLISKPDDEDITVFATGEDFVNERNRILGKEAV